MILGLDSGIRGFQWALGTIHVSDEGKYICQVSSQESVNSAGPEAKVGDDTVVQIVPPSDGCSLRQY